MIVIVFLAAILAVNLSIWKVWKSNEFDRLFVLCVWTTISIWYSIPGVTAAIFQEETPFTPFYFMLGNVTTSDWVQQFALTFFLESFAISCSMHLLLFKKRNNFRNKKRKEYSFDIHYNIREKAKVSILIASLLALIYQILNLQNLDYLALNSAELYGEKSVVSQAADFISSVSYAMTILIAIRESRNRFFVATAFGIITVSSIASTISGARIYMLAPVIVFIFRFLLNESSNDKLLVRGETSLSAGSSVGRKSVLRLFFTIATVFIFVYSIFVPLAKTIADIRSEEFNLANAISITFFEKGGSQLKNDKDKLIEDVEVIFGKLDSFTTGVMLTSASGYGTAGFTPYLGSLLVLFPRSVLIGKPVAGSSDGTIYTIPSRLVTSSVGITSDALNMPVAPLSVNFWHFGPLLGFLLFVSSTVVYLRYLDSLFRSPHFVHQSIGIWALNIPAFSGVFVSSDVILKNIILFSFLVVITNFFVRRQPKY
jgi:hypothetical protein